VKKTVLNEKKSENFGRSLFKIEQIALKDFSQEKVD